MFTSSVYSKSLFLKNSNSKISQHPNCQWLSYSSHDREAFIIYIQVNIPEIDDVDNYQWLLNSIWVLRFVIFQHNFPDFQGPRTYFRHRFRPKIKIMVPAEKRGNLRKSNTASFFRFLRSLNLFLISISPLNKSCRIWRGERREEEEKFNKNNVDIIL